MSEATVTVREPVTAAAPPAGPKGPDGVARLAMATCFFLSGGAGLVYELVWAKHLALFIGSTGLSHTIILASFMGGLALGSWVLGRMADQIAHPLRAYAILELGVGCYGIFYPALASVLEWVYFQAAEEVGIGGAAGLGLKLLLSAALLIPPTFLMGGTLPLLGRFLSRKGDGSRAVSILYFINSFGAVAGTIAGGFFLLPELGLRTTTIITGGVNLAAAALALLTALRADGEEEPAEKDQVPSHVKARQKRVELPPLGPRDRLLLWGITASGLVGMVYELGWVRYFTQVLGSSSHSFTLMLAAFISGITLGGLAASRYLGKVRDLRLLFAVLEAAIGAAVLLPLIGYERFPYWFWCGQSLLQRGEDAYRFHLTFKYLFAFVVMLLPTFFSGWTLPVVTAQLAKRGRVGAQIGLVYAGNTLGTVAGALASGFLLLPLLGIQWTLKVGIILNLAIAASVFWGRNAPAARGPEGWQGCRWRSWALFTCAGLALATVLLPSWDPRLLTFGVFRRSEAPPPTFADYRANLSRLRVPFAEESTDARVLVVESPEGITSLVVNGKSDASNGSDMSTQMLIGHIPMLLHPDPRDVLVVGLGSGVTVGSVLSHRPREPLDCVEILPAVVRAARWFGSWNNNVLEDPGLRLWVDDARSFIRTAKRRYDVIVSEPPNPWVAGVGNLFSTDFYRDCLDHLREGGLMVQFFHAYEMSDELVQVMARTLLRSFPYVYTFNTGSGQADFILLGSREPIRPDFERWRERLAEPAVKADLTKIGLANLPALLLLQSHSPETLHRFSGEGRLNTDDLPIFENEGPRAFFVSRKSEALGKLDERRGAGARLFIHQYLKRFPLSSGELRSMVDLFRLGVVENPSLLFSSLREYLRRAPGDLEGWDMLADELLRAGKPHAALTALEEAREVAKGDRAAELKILKRELAALRPIEKEEITVLSMSEAFPRSKEKLEKCIALDPQGQDLYFGELAKLAFFEGDRPAAARWVGRALRHRRENPSRQGREITDEELEELRRWAAAGG